MQCYRSGKIIGSNNRNLMIAQLVGIPIGAATVSVVYPALRETYGFVGAHALTSPVSVKWAGFAELLAKGFSTLPQGCLTALAIALVLGIILTLLEPRYQRFVPSPTAVGLGMLIPGYAVIPMVIGGIIQSSWAKRSPETESVYNIPIASGFIAGESLVVLAMSMVAAYKSLLQ
jgi:uncharacterized oligopeptide transporter (OPT) family protein